MKNYAIYSLNFPIRPANYLCRKLSSRSRRLICSDKPHPISKGAFAFGFVGSLFLILQQTSFLSPLAKQSHDTSTKQDRDHHESQLAIVTCALGVEQEVSGQQLNEASVDEDTR